MTSPKNQNRLTNAEGFKLGLWLQQIDLAPFSTNAELAVAGEKALGFRLTGSNIAGGLQMVGRALPRTLKPATSDEAVRIIATTLAALLGRLNDDIPPELVALCTNLKA